MKPASQGRKRRGETQQLFSESLFEYELKPNYQP